MKIWNLTLIVIGPILAQFNPIYPKQTLNKYGWDKIQFRPEHKSYLTQWVNLKKILKLNPNWVIGPFLAQLNPI